MPFRSRCQSNIPAGNRQDQHCAKANSLNKRRSAQQSQERPSPGANARAELTGSLRRPGALASFWIRSKATIAQVIKHASRMSASASRPRITVQAVVPGRHRQAGQCWGHNGAWPARQLPGPAQAQPSAEGSRATVSVTPPAQCPSAATSHHGKGGFSSHGKPPIVGYPQSPECRISLAPLRRMPRGRLNGRASQTWQKSQCRQDHQARQPHATKSRLGHRGGSSLIVPASDAL